MTLLVADAVEWSRLLGISMLSRAGSAFLLLGTVWVRAGRVDHVLSAPSNVPAEDELFDKLFSNVAMDPAAVVIDGFSVSPPKFVRVSPTAITAALKIAEEDWRQPSPPW